MAEIGYTHSMFTGNLRAYAQKVDSDAKNGGNNNGMIDGKEIELFKDLVKKETGYNFDFSKIHQSVSKPMLIKDENGWRYHTSMELAAKYSEFGASSQSINALNGGDPFAKEKNSVAYVPFNAEFKNDKKEVDKQEAEVSKRILKMKEEKKAKQQQELHEATKSDFEKFCEKVANWFTNLF